VSEPAPTIPCQAVIHAYVPADGTGQLKTPDGAIVRFGASACKGFVPELGMTVWLMKCGPHPLGGLRAQLVNLDGQLEGARLDEAERARRAAADAQARGKAWAAAHQLGMRPAPAPGVELSLRTIEAWLGMSNHTLDEVFGPPASAADIASAEAELGRPLPDDYRAFLARHDGQRFIATGDKVGHHAQLVGSFELVPLRAARGEYASMIADWDDGTGAITAAAGVKPQYKSARWFPISVIAGSSTHHCLDLDPAPGGTVGQIIRVSMKDDERPIVARSFAELLWLIAEALPMSADFDPARGADLADPVLDVLC
jgi:cell wall assembly regulator SMI1